MFAACHNLILSSQVKGKFFSILTQASYALDSNNASGQRIISVVIFSSYENIDIFHHSTIWMIRSTQTFLTVKLSPIEVKVLQTLAN